MGCIGRKLHSVDANGDRMSQYTEHVGKYDFSSLHFPVPLYSVGSFAAMNNMYIKVDGVDDDKKVIYPFRVSFTLVPDRHVDLLLFERNGIQHYTTIRNFSRLVSSQMLIIIVSSVCTLTKLRNYWIFMLPTAVTRKEPSSPMIRDVDSPTYRNSYQNLLQYMQPLSRF